MNTEKTTIMLALSSSRRSKETIRYALDLAKSQKSEIALVYVVEEETPNRIADYVSDMGFMGEKTSEVLKKSLMEEYRERGIEEIDALKSQCEKEGVSFSEHLLSGKFSDEVLKAADIAHPAVIVLNKREDRSGLERWVFGSEVERIREKAKCQVKVIQGR